MYYSPVSYTHRDAYKRQTEVVVEEQEFAESKAASDANAVSYTHLDVYKRQWTGICNGNIAISGLSYRR